MNELRNVVIDGKTYESLSVYGRLHRIDWRKLREAIRIATKLGAGHTVFMDDGSSRYGICLSSDLPNNRTPLDAIVARDVKLWDWDQLEGPHNVHTTQALLGKQQYRRVMYRVR